MSIDKSWKINILIYRNTTCKEVFNMTLEEAQEQILTLNEQLLSITGERDTLLEDNKNLSNEVENLRTLNQKYFNKLIAQEGDTKNDVDKKEGEEVPTCEEFAKTINL